MTTSVLDRIEMENSLESGAVLAKDPAIVPINKGALSGEELVARAKGLFTKEEVDRLERHINESCEQLDD